MALFCRRLLPNIAYLTKKSARINRRCCFSNGTAEMEENLRLTPEELRRKLREREDPVDVRLSGYRYPSLFHDVNDMSDQGLMRKYKEERYGIPKETDFLIIGGGIIGSSIAYFLKNRGPDSFSLTVIERDLEYTHAATTFSVGGLRQQFSLPEHVEMANFGAEFFRKSRLHLTFLDNEPPDIEFTPQGFLFLANEDNARELVNNHEVQTECGSFVDMLTKEEMHLKFPWLNTEDLLLGSLGAQNEGWFNPRHLLLGLKGKTEFLGADYLHAEVIDWNLRRSHPSDTDYDDLGKPRERANHVILRLPTGAIISMTFSSAIIATGAHSATLTKLLKIGTGEAEGLRSVPLPIEPRKRYVYAFQCIDGPGLDFPFLVDPSGVYCRRDGLGGHFIAGKSPSEDDEPDCSNLDVDYNYFHEVIHPVLKHRVPAFKDIKIVGAWAGLYDYNTFDQCPIIGTHPYYKNIYWATGFGGHGVQMAPAVGRAINELCFDDDQYKTIDLRRLNWERIIMGQQLRESMLL